ncbi:hypothetical protein CUC08_Gglean000891 [Alternaria sp. MG1]|nr:hypothetical protein CUC08_Gglean000891 [Alternaria sp. MG1]
MGHGYHHHSHEKKPLQWFASPLAEDHHKKEHQSPPITRENTQAVLDSGTRSDDVDDGPPLQARADDTKLHDMPEFQRHAEATTQELFFDLFFVANLTTFTSLKEINDSASLTAYIGFFALLWMTWYSNSLFDVRFTADCIFERCAKALHYGVMVGFAVVGPAWEPGKATSSLQKYQVLSFILMVSRLVLASQYAVTLFFLRKHRRTILPMSLVIGSTLGAALIYGSLTASLPKETCNVELGVCKKFTTHVHIAWYTISALEIIFTVGISCVWRVISFKGTHLVQRMSLLTLIILGEGIIVICKAISKIVKNGSQFDDALTGQIAASVLIIYLLYMLYFDRMHEEHFGTIKQQVWASLHFFLHITLVLVLQGVSYLIMCVVALIRMDNVDGKFREIEALSVNGAYANGTLFADALRQKIDTYLWNTIPKGVDASKALETWNSSLIVLAQSFDNLQKDKANLTAVDMITTSLNNAESMAIQTMFDSLSISVPKTAKTTTENVLNKVFDKASLLKKYETRFELVFDYVFLSAGLAIVFIAIIAFISLPDKKRHLRQYMRLLFSVILGLAIYLICLVNTNKPSQKHYMESNWMLPTICIIFAVCVLVSHARPWWHSHYRWHGA